MNGKAWVHYSKLHLLNINVNPEVPLIVAPLFAYMSEANSGATIRRTDQSPGGNSERLV